MNNTLLERIIDNFNINDLISFLGSKLSGFRGEKTDYSHYLKENQFVKYPDIYKIGETTLKGNEQIIAIVAKVNESLTERSSKKVQYEIAKTILRKEFADLAFFIFYGESGSFRFSIVHAEREKNKVQFSTFKRYTYYVSKDQTNKTFKEQIENSNFSSIDEIVKAFSVEKLNKEFYGKINNAFYKLIGGEIIVGSRKQKFDGVLRLPSTDIINNRKKYQEFAVRFIGRIIFCWFLKNKKSEQGKSLIPTNWLSSKNISTNYYHAFIEKLFFELLNKKQNERSKENLPAQNEDVPFLNGGLFDPQHDDFYKMNAISGKSEYIDTLKIPDSWIRELFETLEQYNFTIDENSSIDKEISIDPEMLGTIFENLLAEIDPDTEKSARNSTGSFYTPRPIVEYMVEQSLLAYLQTKTTIDEATLKGIVNNYSDEPVVLTQEEKDSLLTALYEVKILDPACGSGAFPIGCLNKIVDILQSIDPKAEQWKRKQLETVSNAIVKKELEAKLNSSTSDYVRKLGVIQNSIYGVDIQEIAVEISKLRCFLSLVIDETIDESKTNRGIYPLPNLEFKFVAANTLIRLEKENSNLFGSDSSELKQLEELRNDYLQASGKQKEDIKEQFTDLQTIIYEKEQKANLYLDTSNSRATQLSTWQPFSNIPCPWFDSKWMFGVETFDIVIGNPPYRQVAKGIFDKKRFPFSEGKDKGKQNLYKVFVETSYNQTKENGIATMIVQSSLMCDISSQYTRELLLTKTEINEFIEFPKIAKNREGQVFENVLQGTCIYIFKHKVPKNDRSFKVSIDNDITTIRNLKYEDLKQSEIIQFYHKGFFIPLVKTNEIEIIRKMQKSSSPLDQAITEITQGDLNLTNENMYFSNTFSPVKLLRGKHTHRFYIDYTTDEFVQNNYKEKTVKMNQNQKYFVCQQITGTVDKYRLHFALTNLNKNFLFGNSVNKFSIRTVIKEEFLLGILNSKLMDWYFRKTSTNNHVNVYEIEQLPICKNISVELQKPIIMLVNHIIFLKENKNVSVSNTVSNEIIASYFEKIIDACVYELYFNEEIKAQQVDVLELIQKSFDKISLLPIEQQIYRLFEELNDYKNEIRNRIILQETRSESVSLIVKSKL